MSMTENKINPTIEQVIYCLKAGSERYPEVCEECQLYGEVGCDHCYDDVTDMAIKHLKELEQYRAIGTMEEFKALKESKCKYWNAEHEDCTLSYEEIRAKVIDEFAERMKELAVKWFENGKITIGSIDEIAEEMRGVE